MATFSISNIAIDPTDAPHRLLDKTAGAFVSFEGRVRDNNEGHKVLSLEYEVFHSLAVSEGQKILDEAKIKFGLRNAMAIHREGHLAIGDCAVWIGVIARHRGEAFDACRYIIDEIKHRLPIWKKEHYETVPSNWVNCQSHQNSHSQLNFNEELFYSRQTLLPEIGNKGQEGLKQSKVLVVGAGGLGSSALQLLAAAGIGHIGIAEFDRLEISNLHRQILYAASDVGMRKVDLAARRLRALNPFIKVSTHPEKITAENIEQIFLAYDLILDCTDNFITKYLLNDAAILFKKLLIQASLYRFEGQLLTIDGSKESGCLRCLWPTVPEEGFIGDCATIGVLGTVPAILGGLQANEAVRYLLGLSVSSLNNLVTMDLTTLETTHVKRQRRATCQLCGQPGTIKTIASREDHIYDQDLEISIELDESSAWTQYALIDVREQDEQLLNPVKGAISFSFSQLDKVELDLPYTTSLLIFCAQGVRSRIVTKRLRMLGWEKAFSLKGGISRMPIIKDLKSA